MDAHASPEDTSATSERIHRTHEATRTPCVTIRPFFVAAHTPRVGTYTLRVGGHLSRVGGPEKAVFIPLTAA